jgi:Uma2 family endonuclease
MVQIPTIPENQILPLNLPLSIGLHVTQEQFAILAVANRDLKLERNARGELIVNPPTGWETGQRNLSISGQLYRWYEENENLGKAFDSSTRLLDGEM